MSSTGVTQPARRMAAFARVPRGAPNASGTGPAAPLVRIDAKFIEGVKRAQMNSDLSTIMTNTQTSLHISIAPNGTSTLQTQKPDGMVVMDEQDIKRTLSLNASLNMERKEAQKAEAGPNLIANLAAIVDIAKEMETPLTTVPKNFVEVFRSVNTSAQVLARNTATIEDFKIGDSEIRSVLLEMCKRSRCAIGHYTMHRAHLQEHETARKLNSFVLEQLCPIYFFNKLTSEIVNTSAPDFDLLSLIWPSDPSKGFYLNFREIIERQMQNYCGRLTEAWSIIGLLTKPEILEAFTNARLDSLTEFDDATKLGSKVAGIPFLIPIPQPFFRAKNFFNFLAKNGGRGIQWRAGSVISPQDNLRFLGTIAKRVEFLSVPNISMWATRLGGAFPGFVYDPLKTEQDFFVQLKAWSIQPNQETIWPLTQDLAALLESKIPPERKAAAKDLMIDLLQFSLSAPKGTPAGNALNAGIAQIDIEMAEPTDPGVYVDVWSEIKKIAQTHRNDIENAKARLTGKVTLPSHLISKGKGKAAKARPAGSVERTPLTKAGKTVISDLKRRGMVALAERMDGWFRQFLTVEGQSAVANLYLARLDALMSAPIILNRQERVAFLGQEELEENESQVGSGDEEEEGDAASSADDEEEVGQNPPNNPDDQ